jgi:Cu(I)/Ag(I) efflux system periplasmic protein CusF
MTSQFSLLLVALSLAGPALAQQHPAATTPATAAAAADYASGEVRKVYPDAGQILLKHGEIKSIDMPPMSMVFKVKDKAMLERVKVGDKVRFKAASIGGENTVTEIQVLP